MSVPTGGHCVIVGAGHAGAQCAFALRKEGWTGPVTMIGEEPVPPYHRPPLSKTYLKGETPLDSLLIRPLSLYEKNDIARIFGQRVELIDRAGRTVRLCGGETVSYDCLILATGSVHCQPPIAGIQQPGVHFLRTAAEADALREAAKTASRAVIIGGGYIGLEVAASLRGLGLTVTLLHRGARVLSRVTGPEISAFFEGVHCEEGVDLQTRASVEAIERVPGGLRVRTRAGGVLEAGLVLVGTGAAPNTGLAQAAGLECAQDGIVVDEHTRTSDPDILAIGDCTLQHHPRLGRAIHLESVQNANDQAKTAAAALTGKPIPMRPIPWFWSDQYDIKLQSVGLPAGYTDCVIRRNAASRRSLSAWYFLDGRLLAVDAVNDPTAYVVGGKVIEGHLPLDRTLLADPAHDLKSFVKRTPGATP